MRAPPSLCNGAVLPIVTIDQLYSFEENHFLAGFSRYGRWAYFASYADLTRRCGDALVKGRPIARSLPAE